MEDFFIPGLIGFLLGNMFCVVAILAILGPDEYSEKEKEE